MPVSDFYTSDDLLVRRVYMADWICNQLTKFVNYFNYGVIIKKDCLIKHQYMVALLEAIECYTPITLVDQDGVDNCLKEAQLDTIFNKVEEITGLCFLAKGTTYNPNYDSTVALSIISLNAGGDLITNDGEDFDYNLDIFGKNPNDLSKK